MATIEQLSGALLNADKAGDVAAAKALAAEIRRMQAGPTEAAESPYDARDSALGKADTVFRGAMDTLSLGTADEIGGAIEGSIDWLQGKGYKQGYNRFVEQARKIDAADAEKRPIYRGVGQVAGALTGGVGLAKGGLSLATNAAKAGAGLGRVSGASALEGGLYGLGHGAGSGTDADSRLRGALIGGGVGLGVGMAAPSVVATAANLAKPVIAPIMGRLRPGAYTNAAVGSALERSNMSVDDIVNQLDDAQRAGQGNVYTVADAMGNSGQRMLTAVTRTPNNARQGATDFLTNRQAGQGRRVVNALSEGFDAPVTAKQRTGALTAARGAAADIGYEAARQNAGMVNVSGALAAIDEVLRPGSTSVMRPGSSLADDSIEGALSKARKWLGNGREQLTGFNEALRVKQDIDDLIGAAVRSGANNKARLLGKVRDKLDEALEAASGDYGAARDAFRQGSKKIEAVGTGSEAAMRGRPEDTINTFSLMMPEEQAAFRVGYSDPLIRETQTAAVGVNKARPLINDATAAEFPAFAAPGQGDRLAQRLAREQRMFETTGTALGGSKTADNISDIIDMGNFDPGVWSNLLSGHPIKAAASAVMRVFQESRGLPPSVIERVARVLLTTRPDVARQLLTEAQNRTTMNAGMRGLADAIINNSAGAISGRAAASQ